MATRPARRLRGGASGVGSEQALRSAIARGAMRLVYQPIVDLDSGTPVGVEALVRWDHPTLGTVSPADFIPLAEHTELIVPLGKWILEQACCQVAAWRALAANGFPLSVSVNLSARQLARPKLLELVRHALERSHMSPERLALELTESVLMETEGTPVHTVEALRELGIRVLLDDFGTGYSSLSYLARVPVDGIKIDRSFTLALGAGAQHPTKVFGGIVAMARSIGLTVVAEGVETEQQARRVDELGCHRAQGYWFAPPLVPESLEELLTAGARLPRVSA